MPAAPPGQAVDSIMGSRSPKPTVDSSTYVATAFTLALADDWTDATVFILSGPYTDGVQHNVTVVIDSAGGVGSLTEYVDLQVRPLDESLTSCRILLREPTQLANGMPAYRVIYSWHPIEGRRLYQEQLYVLHEGVGYKLTATFSKKTRKTLGPQVERMMLSFEPGRPEAAVASRGRD